MRILISLCAGLISISLAVVAAPPVQKCELCHAKPGFQKKLDNGQIISLYVPPDSLAQSVHSKRECNECHRDVNEIPHKPGLQWVDCTGCHYIGNLAGAPELPIYEQYRESVHGRAALAGNKKAPICQDCHGAHNVQKYHAEGSPLNRQLLPASCGRCHIEAYRQFASSIHGKLLSEGNPAVPTCTDCHGEHTIEKPEEPGSAVFSTRIPETCGKCHAAENIVSKYGVSIEQVETYTESFHGIATTFGSKKAANCASCHGSHDILPATDQESRIFPANIPKTCGKCHPEANANWARGKIHVNASNKDAGIIYYVAAFFKWLTISTLVGLVINIILDLRRRLMKNKKS
jgi:hypothetical protein